VAAQRCKRFKHSRGGRFLGPLARNIVGFRPVPIQRLELVELVRQTIEIDLHTVVSELTSMGSIVLICSDHSVHVCQVSPHRWILMIHERWQPRQAG
jgi:hypothetical protein